MIVIAIAAAAVMAFAVAVVLIAVVVSVRGEDRHGQLPHHAPTPIARCVRRLTGLRVCHPGNAGLYPQAFTQKATGQVHQADPANSPGQVIDEPSNTQAGNRRSA